VTVLGDVPVAARDLGAQVPELDQLLDSLPLARVGAPYARFVRVHLRVAAEVVEAGVPLARTP